MNGQIETIRLNNKGKEVFRCKQEITQKEIDELMDWWPESLEETSLKRWNNSNFNLKGYFARNYSNQRTIIVNYYSPKFLESKSKN